MLNEENRKLKGKNKGTVKNENLIGGKDAQLLKVMCP